MNRSMTQKLFPCLTCNGTEALPFFKLDSIPVNCGTLATSSAESIQTTRGDIQLAICQKCGLVFNTLYDPSLIEFGNQYEVSLNSSPTFRDFSLQTANRLAKEYELENKLVFEIGCGNGEFLETICRVGKCNGFGIDPTVKRQGEFQIGSQSIRFERSRFDAQFVQSIGNLVICLSVFEDIRQPAAFLQHLKQRMQGQSIPLYFEVFNGFRTFENLDTWSVHYEQCNYFSLESLRRTFELNGFQIVNSGHCYVGDQYLFVEALPSDGPFAKPNPINLRPLQFFQSRFQDAISKWNTRLRDFAPGQVIFWGAGGKSITFLNVIDEAYRIHHVVDNNPKRQGKFIPGSGQQIITPDDLKSLKPELVVISNSIYREEISQQLQELGIKCKMEVA